LATTFLSYSRLDAAFARRLQAALKAAGEETWVDWSGIPPTAEFALEINKGIEGSNNFVFLLSPDSLASTSYCLKEIAHAAKMGKRMIPLYLRTVPQEMVPESLARLNYIFFRETDDFDTAFAKLISALHTDLAWTSMSSRILVRAVEWDQQGRDGSFLLRGKDLTEAEIWLAQAASKEGKPTELQSAYILESRKLAVRTQRRIRNALIGGLALVILGAGAAVYEAIAARRQAAVATSRSLATAALLAKDQDFSLALLLSVEAQNSADTYDSRNSIVTLWQAWPHLVRFDSPANENKEELVAPKIVAGSRSELMVAWKGSLSGGGGHAVLERTDGEIVREPLAGAPADGGDYEISPDGSLLVASGNQGIQVWTLTDFIPHRVLLKSREEQQGAVYGYYTEQEALVPHLATFDPLVSGVVAVIDVQGRFSYQDPVTGSPRNEVNPKRAALINSLLPVLPPMTRKRPGRSPITQAEIDAEQHRNERLIQQIAFRPQGNELAFSQGYNISVADLNRGQVLTRLNASVVPLFTKSVPSVDSLSFSPDGNFLAAVDRDGQLGVWAVQDAYGLEHFQHFDLQDDISQGYQHRSDATWSADGTLNAAGAVWRPGWPRGTRFIGPLQNLPESAQDVQMPVFIDASTVITLYDSARGIASWQVQKGTGEYRDLAFMGGTLSDYNLNHILATDGGTVLSLANLSSTGSSSGRPPSEHGSVKLGVRRWDVLHGRELAELIGPSIDPYSDYSHLLTGDANRQGDVAVTLLTERRNPDSSFASSGVALLWRTKRPEHAERIPLGSGEVLLSLAFEPDGKVLAGIVSKGRDATEGSLRLWSTGNLREIRSVAVKVDYRSKITFSRDGSLLYVLPWIYEAPTLKQFKGMDERLEGPPVSFAPRNRQIAIDDDHMVSFWDIEARRQLGAEIDAGGHTVGPGGYRADGESFSPDGSLLAIAYRGGRLKLWRNPLVGWPELACSVANRNLTADEWQLNFASQNYRKTCPGLPDGRGVPAS
jgi:WD40 repeat protein